MIGNETEAEKAPPPEDAYEASATARMMNEGGGVVAGPDGEHIFRITAREEGTVPPVILPSGRRRSTGAHAPPPPE